MGLWIMKHNPGQTVGNHLPNIGALFVAPGLAKTGSGYNYMYTRNVKLSSTAHVYPRMHDERLRSNFHY